VRNVLANIKIGLTRL